MESFANLICHIIVTTMRIKHKSDLKNCMNQDM